MRRLAAGVCTALALAACSSAGEAGDATAPPDPTATGPTATTSGTPSGPVQDRPDLLGEEPTSTIELSQRCESPLGFALSYPAGWAVNSGATVAGCTRFAPGAFDVPPGTDARVGSVSASVETAPFDRVSSPQTPPPGSRIETTVDGRRAVRLEQVSAGQGLYVAGIRITSYVVELAPEEDGPRILVVNTVGLPQFDYARNVRILDRMVQTLTFTD